MCGGGLLIVLKIVAMLEVGRNQIGPSTHEHDRSMTLCSHPNDRVKSIGIIEPVYLPVESSNGNHIASLHSQLQQAQC